VSAVSHRLAASQQDNDFWWRLWQESKPIAGTIAAQYLLGRGLSPPDNDEALRYHPRCPFKGRRTPVILGLFRDALNGVPTGIHRTALRADGTDRDRELGKAMLGRVRGSAVKLTPNEETTLGLGICEGIETGMAILAADWRPVWAVGSAGFMAKFPVLSGIEALTVFADLDSSGVGQRAAMECAERWRAAGVLATVHIPRGNAL
jgi:hypothetical protein